MFADGLAKEAAEVPSHSVRDEILWQASLPHLSRRVTESRARETAQWVASHVRPERRYRPLSGSGLRRKQLGRTPKALAGRHHQLLSCHVAIGSFPHDRMTGPQMLETDGCWWCNCGKRQSHCSGPVADSTITCSLGVGPLFPPSLAESSAAVYPLPSCQ